MLFPPFILGGNFLFGSGVCTLSLHVLAVGRSLNGLGIWASNTMIFAYPFKPD